jgi:hypothetical protein
MFRPMRDALLAAFFAGVVLLLVNNALVMAAGRLGP